MAVCGASASTSWSSDPVNPETLYAAAYPQGVYKSINGGRRWLESDNGLGAMTVGDFAIDPSNPSNLYAATYSGLFKSTNAGLTWFLSSSGLSQLPTNSVAVDSSAPLTVYAATPDGIYKSVDGAANWSKVSVSGINGYAFSLLVDTSNPPAVYAFNGGSGDRVHGEHPRRGLQDGRRRDELELVTRDRRRPLRAAPHDRDRSVERDDRLCRG